MFDAVKQFNALAEAPVAAVRLSGSGQNSGLGLPAGAERTGIDDLLHSDGIKNMPMPAHTAPYARRNAVGAGAPPPLTAAEEKAVTVQTGIARYDQPVSTQAHYDQGAKHIPAFGFHRSPAQPRNGASAAPAAGGAAHGQPFTHAARLKQMQARMAPGAG